MGQANEPSYIAAIDIGGTFTDLVMQDTSTGEICNLKVSSTPTDFATGFGNAFKRLAELKWGRIDRIKTVFHGTTVGTNAVIERRIPSLGLLTTRGMRDVLEIRRHWRGPGDLYNFFLSVPEPLVPRDRRKEVTERILPSGEVLVPLDVAQTKDAIAELRESGVEALAVCLLHAYINPSHERRIRELIEDVWPGVPVSVSHEVCGELREYERTSTTVLNAALLPIMRAYLNRIDAGLQKLGINGSLQIMQSNGGLMTPSVVADRPVTTLLSGPVGGVMGGVFVGSHAGEDKVITMDMGGTSCDVCLVESGKPRITTENQIEGNPVRVPMFDMITIGAGGGSIAWIDQGGTLQVGPRSAGARPGPACYGHGGVAPTITDANVVLGRIHPSSFLGDSIKVQPELAQQAVDTIAKALGMSTTEAALGILQIANAKMVESIKVVSVRKGFDPRDFSLVVGGGAGPLHGPYLVDELKMRQSIVPLSPGTMSAFGLLTSDVKYDIVKSYVRPADQIDVKVLNQYLGELSKTGEDRVRTSQVPLRNVVPVAALDLRYLGQAYEIVVPLRRQPVATNTIADCVADFHRAHEAMFGYSMPEEDVELVNIRVQVVGTLPSVAAKPLERGSEMLPAGAQITTREVVWEGGSETTAILARSALLAGNRIAGPAIIEQFDTTVAIPPDHVAHVDAYGNLIIGSV